MLDHCPICRESTPPTASDRPARSARPSDRAPDERDALRQPAERHPPAGEAEEEGGQARRDAFLRSCALETGASEALARDTPPPTAGGPISRLRDSPRDYRTPGRFVYRSSGVRDIV